MAAYTSWCSGSAEPKGFFIDQDQDIKGEKMRGFWFMLEAVLAGVLLIGFMLVLGQVFTPPSGGPDISVSGYSQLQQLNDQFDLRYLASSEDIPAIESAISVPGYSHSVEVCDPSGSCTGNMPSEREVWISSYILSGEDSYTPRIVKLYLWREE
jgi:hypothetical protein